MFLRVEAEFAEWFDELLKVGAEPVEVLKYGLRRIYREDHI
jgi:hypothetical protein